MAELCQKGCLPTEVAMRFADLSCQALQKGCRVKNLHWLVEVCCWGEDEERDREMRSVMQVVVATAPIMYMYDPRKTNSESFFKHYMYKILAICKPICLTTLLNATKRPSLQKFYFSL